jgi:hypothetical protein
MSPVADLYPKGAQEVTEEAVDVKVAHVEWDPAEGTDPCARFSDSGRSEAVEGCSPLRIAQDLISAVELLESKMGAVVPRVFIWMVVSRELAERALDLVLRRGPVHAKDVIRVTHVVRDSIQDPGPHLIAKRQAPSSR